MQPNMDLRTPGKPQGPAPEHSFGGLQCRQRPQHTQQLQHEPDTAVRRRSLTVTVAVAVASALPSTQPCQQTM